MAGLVQSVGTGESNTSNTTVAASVSNVPTPGNCLLAFGINATDTTELVSVSDGLNPWEILLPGGAGGMALWVARTQVRGDMTGATVTATLEASDTQKLLWVTEWTGLGAFRRVVTAGVAFNGTSRNVAGQTVAASIGGVLVGFWGVVSLGGESSLTAGTGFTNFPSATGSGYLNGSAVNGFIEGIWRETASAAAEQPLATGGASPVGYDALALAFEPIRPRYLDQSQFPKVAL